MDEKLSGTVGLNTTDFKTGLAEMNRELRIVESGFRASAAALGDWASDASGLEMRIKALTSSIEIQKEKVAAVRAEYERMKAEKGENSRAAQDLEIKLNKETETLGKMENELGSTESALEGMKSGEEGAGGSAQEMGEKVEKSGSKVEDFKKVLGGVAAVAKGVVVGLAAVGGAALAAVTAMVGLALNTAKNADELSVLSLQTGISTTRLQELRYAGEILGTELNTITGANARLIRSMAGAQAGTGEQADAFKQLGVSVTDSSGNLLDSQAVFASTLDALKKITNPAERDALAMAIFGKSAQELNPLIAAGSDELARLSEEAHKNGAVMSEEAVAGAAAFQDQLDSLTMGLKGIGGTIGSLLMPAFSGLANQAQGYLQDLTGIVQGSGGDINKMINGFWTVTDEGETEFHGGIMDLITEIVTDLAAQAPKMLQAGLTIVQTILTAITSALPTLIPAAIAMITSLVMFLVQNLPLLLQAAVQLILALVQGIVPQLPLLLQAALMMVITLVQGIASALPTLIPAAVQAIVTLVTTLIENLPMLLEAALQLILALVMGLAAALPILIAAVPTILIAIINTLTAMLPMLVEMAPEIILALITGIIGALPALAEAIPQIIDTIKTVINDLEPQMIQAGMDILAGIWDGIKAKLPWFWEQIKAFALQIWAEIKNALGIQSPSKLFAETIGAMIPAGIWQGIAAGMPDLEKQLAAAMRNLSGSYDIALNGRMGGAFAAAGVSSFASEHFAFYAPVYFQQAQAPGSLGAVIKARRY